MSDESPVNVGNGIFGESPFDDEIDKALADDAKRGEPAASPSVGFATAPFPRQNVAPLMPPTAQAPAQYVGPVPGPFVFTGVGDSGSGSTNVGRALLLVGLGATLGYTQLGVKGALIGALWGGAASNTWSATTSTPEERVVAGTWAVIEGAAAAYLTWSALKKDKGE